MWIEKSPEFVCAGKEFLTSLNSGFLRKRGHRFKNWKRRFFVLHADSLTYSERQGSKIKGQLRLTSKSSVETVELKRFGKAFCLSIKANADEDDPLFIQAESNDELSTWRDALVRTINACAGLSDGLSLDAQRRKSAGLPAGEVEEGLPSTSDPPSWLRTGLLNRALKEDWQQNFFVLHSNGLLQGYSKRGGKLVAEVNVTKFEARTLSPTEISGFNHCFQLQKPKTKIPLTLQASNDEERDSWMTAITSLQSLLAASTSGGSSTASMRSLEKSQSQSSLALDGERDFELRDGVGGKPVNEVAAAIVASVVADAAGEDGTSAFGYISAMKLLNPDRKADF